MNYRISLFLVFYGALGGFSQSFNTETWMRDLSVAIHDKTPSDLVLPGAYRCGLQRVGESTANPTRCNTQSQTESVQGLLNLGARYLDFSVVYWKNAWYLGAFGYSYRDGLQIAVGQPLDKALDEVAAFLSEKDHGGEVVIVHISRYVDSRLTMEKKEKLEEKKDVFAETSFGLLDSLKKDELLKLCSRRLSALLYPGGDPLNTRIDTILASVHKTGKKTGAAILLASDSRKLASYPGVVQTGQCQAKYGSSVNTCFRKTDSLLVLNREWPDWCAGNAGCYQVRRWVLSWRNNESKCTQQLAQTANEGLARLLDDAKMRPHGGVCCLSFPDRALSEKIIGLNIIK